MLQITVNGEPREIPEGTTLAALIENLPIPHRAYAVEVNRALVPRREHPATSLTTGDAVEIVTLVGGG